MKRKTTIDDLAVMIKRGFDDTVTKADLQAVKKELKEDISRLEREIAELRDDVSRLTPLPAGIERRLDRVEDDMRLVKTKVGIR